VTWAVVQGLRIAITTVVPGTQAGVKIGHKTEIAYSGLLSR